jgi:hypothetical protein
MLMKEFLGESATDVVARFYKEASAEADRFYNPEDVKYKTRNTEYYSRHFSKWFNEEIIPVFTKPIDKPQPEYNVIPKEGKHQSPGYRGLQYAMAAAGLPYDHKVQRYEANPHRMLASQTMDGARNANSQ